MVVENLQELAPKESDPLRVIVGDLGSLGDERAELGEEGERVVDLWVYIWVLSRLCLSSRISSRITNALPCQIPSSTARTRRKCHLPLSTSLRCRNKRTPASRLSLFGVFLLNGFPLAYICIYNFRCHIYNSIYSVHACSCCIYRYLDYHLRLH